MKVIALYPIGNNEYDYLKLSLQSITKIVDEIIVLIDHPFIDNKNKSIIKLLNTFSAKIYFQSKNKIKKSTVDREFLFQLGRKHSGTHFICIDCDEIISSSFIIKSNNILKKMKTGEKIMMRWLSTWKNPYFYRIDKKSIWSNMWKDFIVCDDIKQSYNSNYGFHEPRTIGRNDKLKYLKIEDGCVIHLQFIDWQSFTLKQIYYSLHDLFIKKENISKINRKYYYSFVDNLPKLKRIPCKWLKHINNNDYRNIIKLDNTFFWKKKILRLIKNQDIKQINSLNVWFNKFLCSFYFKKTNRIPKLPLFEKNKLILFYIKSTLQNIMKKND
jgi:hypothetical protein